MLCTIFYYMVLFFIAVKIFAKMTTGLCRSNTCLIGKTVLITGGNSGIGYEAALGLAARGCRLIIASRTVGEDIIEKIYQATGNRNVVAKKLDLMSLASVRSFVADLLGSEERLDVLINNSGVGGMGKVYTEDGLLAPMQVNHFAPFLLTTLLVPLLKKTPGARIIFTSSNLAFTHQLEDLENLNQPYRKSNADFDQFIDFRVYSNSKLCNIIAARYFAKKLRSDGITSNSHHPGMVVTPIYDKSFSNYRSKFFIKCFYYTVGLLLKTPWEGAQTTLHLALSKDLENVGGKYFWDCRPFYLPSLARSPEFCQRLIDDTISLLKLTKEEML